MPGRLLVLIGVGKSVGYRRYHVVSVGSVEQKYADADEVEHTGTRVGFIAGSGGL